MAVSAMATKMMTSSYANNEDNALPTTLLHLIPSTLESINPIVPELYHKSIQLLRETNMLGRWNNTTPKHRMVMVSNVSASNGYGSSVYNSSGSKKKVTNTTTKTLLS